jgi:hypothetical protein
MTTAPRTLRLEYSLPDAVLRGNSRAHWAKRAKAAKKMRDDAYWMGMQEGLEHTFAKARITYHFYHWRKIDLDNLAIGLKPFVDGLVDAMVIPDDTPEHVAFGEHTFTRQVADGDPTLGSRVEIVVEEITVT